MKTKIIYISGNEIFDMADIRAAFEEVRKALQLGPDTVLFGVPVDKEDAGLGTVAKEEEIEIQEPVMVETKETVIQPEPIEPDIDVPVDIEPIVEKPKAKRGRAKKEHIDEPKVTEIVTETTEISEASDLNEPEIQSADDKVVPILSVLSTKSNNNEDEEQPTETVEFISEDTVKEEQEIVDEESDDIITDLDEEPAVENEGEPDLEKLLSAMTPLQEDSLEEIPTPKETVEEETDEDTVDATLEQLATEFAETQDKIASETKSSGRGKIGKLRNILPFKQSKNKDQGLKDLFGWAGVAANDEEFSVPGFFTNANSKK